MVLFLISLLPYLIFSIFKIRKAIHMLQQNYYDESERYFLWILNNPKKIWLELDISFLFLILLNFINGDAVCIAFGIFYFLLLAEFHHERVHEQVKKPLVVTARVKRLWITIFFLYVIMITPMILCYSSKMVVANYLYLGFVTYLSYLVVKFANTINKPIERCVYFYYKNKALKKMKEMKIPVIGITGSYGKTSSKNVIHDILNVKYNAFVSPKNFNTPYGLILSINNYLDKFEDYFIAEMGAFKIGEIAETCKLMKPTYGVLTTIGEAHLESFGSRENIQKGKFELVESLSSEGFAILNGDDSYQKNYQVKNNCSLYWVGIENHEVDAYATNIKMSYEGSSFDIYFKEDEKFYSFQTKLLGKHNIYNILSGVLLGKKLGMNIADLQRGVSRIVPVEHRLELKKIGELNVIDDAYNSNPVGAKMAIDVLGMMPGEKFIVTPGMIELGVKQYEANKVFGTQIASVADYAILIGKEQTKPIYDGLVEANFSKDKIYILNDVRDSFPLVRKLKKEDAYVLLENDLPDLFNE